MYLLFEQAFSLGHLQKSFQTSLFHSKQTTRHIIRYDAHHIAWRGKPVTQWFRPEADPPPDETITLRHRRIPR